MKIVNRVEIDFTLEQIRTWMLGEGVSSIAVAIDDKEITEVYKIEKVYKIEPELPGAQQPKKGKRG